MNKTNSYTIILLLVIFIIAGFWVMFGNFSAFNSVNTRKTDTSTMPQATSITDNIGEGNMIEQRFVCSTSVINNISIVFVRNYHVDNAVVNIELTDGYKTLAISSIKASDISSQHRTYLSLPKTVTNAKGKTFSLKIYSTNDMDSGVAVMYNDKAASKFRFGDTNINGSICFAIEN